MGFNSAFKGLKAPVFPNVAS